MVSDTIGLSRNEGRAKLAQGINFQLAKKVTGFPQRIEADGIIGLAPEKRYKNDPDVFMD